MLIDAINIKRLCTSGRLRNMIATSKNEKNAATCAKLPQIVPDATSMIGAPVPNPLTPSVLISASRSTPAARSLGAAFSDASGAGRTAT